MTIYQKIQTVSVELQDANLSKSGKNKFAGFSYFELADFLPTVNRLFLEHGLMGYCTFKEDYAYLIVADSDTGETVEVTSPMVSIDMKGANPIQALGAVETYQRRYLYLALLGIVENDSADATSHSPEQNALNAEKAKKVIAEIETILKTDNEKIAEIMTAVEDQAKRKYGLADWRGLPLASLQNMLKKLGEVK